MRPLDLQRCKLPEESFHDQVPHVYHLCDEQRSPGMGRKQLEESAENRDGRMTQIHYTETKKKTPEHAVSY